MYKEIETLYLKFRKFICILFEAVTCRTKPDYNACNCDEDESVYFTPPS